MNTISAPLTPLAQEAWPDNDFDMPEGHSIHESMAKGDSDDEDWDVELQVPTADSQVRIMRPILSLDDVSEESASTIKAAALQDTIKPAPDSPDMEDFADAFSLPADLTRISLAPNSHSHHSSKASFEWEDTDHTVSSQSSDAYSTLGLADTLSLTSTSSASPTETDDDDDFEDDLDGVVFPSAIFDSGKGRSHLATILANKATTAGHKAASPDDDFEMGLVIGDDADFSPSRLLFKPHSRSHSMPVQRHVPVMRSPSRLKHDRGKSSFTPPPASSARQLEKAWLSSSPSPRRIEQSMQSPTSSPTPTSSFFLALKPGSLRGQRSSKSSTNATSSASGSGTSSSSVMDSEFNRYDASTTASRAKSYKSVGRIMHDWVVPPTRPSTPNTNTAALRLTLPTAGRFKSRPALSSIFGSDSSSTAPKTPPRSPPRVTSPPPSRPASRLARLARTSPNNPPLAAPRVLRKPKRQRTYGDGTELDNLDDLPTNRDQETRFRVQPKGYGNRIPGGTFFAKGDKGTIRSKSSRKERSDTPPLKRPSKSDSSYLTFFGAASPPRKKKKNLASPPHIKRKPTLIRNLGGVGSPKVVGDMKWNPHTMRWEGNDHVLREFDNVVTSTRPALITHLTGSSVGSPVKSSSFAAGARRVGNMIFDPARLCWVSTLAPEEDEPDVFANLADDEDEIDCCRRSAPPSCTPSPAKSSHTRDSSECSEHDRGSRASLVYDIDEDFVKRCRAAEERHSGEMKGWKSSLSKTQDVFSDSDRTFLYTLRDLAIRKLPPPS